MNRRELLTGAALLAGAGQANAFGIGKLGTGLGRLGLLGKAGNSFPLSGAIIDEIFTTGQYYPRAIATELVDTRASDQWVTTAGGVLVKKAPTVLPISTAGMLVEPAATDLFLQSGNGADAAWGLGAGGLTTAAGDTGPSGATTTKLIPTTSALTAHFSQQGPFTVASGATVTHWRIVKANGYNWAALSIFDSAHHIAWFNLATGAVGTVQTGVTASTPKSLSNGYWLIGITFTITGTAAYGTLFPATADNSNASTWGGDGVSGINQDVGQLEVGAGPTSYIETTTASATRAANSITIQRTGIGRIVFTFDDASQQTISGINTAAQYTILTNLNRPLITRMTGYAA
jgi:hypothetical protein